ncbi:hypothetical protein [Streptomyces sp. NPDC020681]|uniref:hypothetical protein n=1 Tax=Streptomyces sp. NPDC020681 TaxID=3365083 RepID=UPI0037AF4D8B
MGGPRLSLIARTVRPTALLGAVATLFGALFICLSPPAEHDMSAGHHRSASRSASLSASLSASTSASRSASDGPEAAYSCPYDDGACGLLPLVSPAVLTAPPPAAPLDAGAQPPRLDQPPGTGPQHPSQAQPRAPDLHVLQVLRT